LRDPVLMINPQWVTIPFVWWCTSLIPLLRVWRRMCMENNE
jgi:hypothetical protein